MYQKLSVVSLLALSAAAAASPSRIVKRDASAQMLPNIQDPQPHIYKTIEDADNDVEGPALGDAVYTTLDAVDAVESPEYAPVPDLPNVADGPEENAPVDNLPLVPESPEVPETPEVVVPADDLDDDLNDDLPLVPDSPDVPYDDESMFTEADAADNTPAENVPDIEPVMTTPVDAEPTMNENDEDDIAADLGEDDEDDDVVDLGEEDEEDDLSDSDSDDGEDDMSDLDVDVDAEQTESLTSSMEPVDFNSTMSESVSITVDAEPTESLKPSDLTTVTIFSTTTFSISDCGPTVACTGGADETVTSVIAVSTTICPVSEASKFATVAPNPPSMTVIDKDSSDDIVEDVYEQEVVVEVDDEEITTTIELTSTRLVTQFITLDEAQPTDVSTVDDVDEVVVDDVTDADIVDDLADGVPAEDIVDSDDTDAFLEDEDDVTLTISSTTTVVNVVTVTPPGSVEGSPNTEGVDADDVAFDSTSSDGLSDGPDSVDFDSNTSDGFSDEPGFVEGAPECVPSVSVVTETVTEKETVTEPVTIIETVTVAFTSDAPFVATMLNSTDFDSFNQTATDAVAVVACATDAIDADVTDSPCGIVYEIEPVVEPEVTDKPCCVAADGSDNVVDTVPTSFSTVPKAAESPLEPVYGYDFDAYDSYDSY